ncbi:hypothetical protein, partial [Kitasatospora sp. Root107]|uniref:hypothetical protein n=1 Tax=Kitasatospora sp. Root107 TaxID=1736424 RepID=UPI001F20E46C
MADWLERTRTAALALGAGQVPLARPVVWCAVVGSDRPPPGSPQRRHEVVDLPSVVVGLAGICDIEVTAP